MQRNPAEPRNATVRQVTWLAMCLIFVLGTGCKGEKVLETAEPAGDTNTPLDSSELATMRDLHRQAPGVHNQRWMKNDSTLLSFCLSVPEGIDLEQDVPLVLFLHPGAKTYFPFFGREMITMLILPILEDTRAIVVAPDIADNSWTSERSTEQVKAIIDKICETYPVDRERILLMGYSMGASGVWHFASRFPDLFSAAVPIAGGPPLNYASTRWTVPMLCVQSTSDEVFPMQKLRAAITVLQKTDMTVQLFEVQGVSHYSSPLFIEPGQKALDWVKQVWDKKAEEKSLE